MTCITFLVECQTYVDYDSVKYKWTSLNIDLQSKTYGSQSSLWQWVREEADTSKSQQNQILGSGGYLTVT